MMRYALPLLMLTLGPGDAPPVSPTWSLVVGTMVILLLPGLVVYILLDWFGLGAAISRLLDGLKRKAGE